MTKIIFQSHDETSGREVQANQQNQVQVNGRAEGAAQAVQD